MFFRGIAEELFWFIRGSTNNEELNQKNIHIWDGHSSREYLDSIGLHHYKVGDLGPIYGFQWRHFGAHYIDASENYTGQGIDQLTNIINALKNNPYDRRILMCSWNPLDLSKMALPPCHCLVQFYVANGELSCHLYQRSADMGLGVPFNIASYALLTHLLAHVTNLIPKELIISFGDVHIYTNHIKFLQLQIDRNPLPFPTMKINPNIKEIDKITYDDLTLMNYNSYDKINMEMAV
jgi:thymidylate synthase